MKIISIGGFFHDLNFAFFDTAKNIVLSVEEERFSRVKGHSVIDESSTSILGVKWMAKEADFDLGEIELLILSDKKNQKITAYLCSLFPNAKIIKIGHHKSHLYNVTAFNNIKEDCDAYCFDAYGDGFSGCHGSFAKDIGCKIDTYFDELNSLGLLYTSATSHLGLGGFGSEGKLQGLASYGQYNTNYSLKEYLSVSHNGPQVDKRIREKSIWSEQELYSKIQLQTNNFYGELIPRRFADEDLTQFHYDFARTIQDDIFNVINQFISLTKTKDNILISGGIAQNSSLINFISQSISCNVYTSTSCSDRGNAIGALQAYLYETNQYSNLKLNPFLGFDADKELINSDNLRLIASVRSCFKKSSEILIRGDVIATFLGRAELGSRALGNRSLLSSPKDKSKRDFLNKFVKHRELFRPFAPILNKNILEQAFQTFNIGRYMTECLPATEWFIEKYPSAVHVDGTARVQVITDITPVHFFIEQLIDLLASEYDLDCLINTSFNNAGDPIVNDLADVIESMQKCGIKYLLTSRGLYELQ